MLVTFLRAVVLLVVAAWSSRSPNYGATAFTTRDYGCATSRSCTSSGRNYVQQSPIAPRSGGDPSYPRATKHHRNAWSTRTSKLLLGATSGSRSENNSLGKRFAKLNIVNGLHLKERVKSIWNDSKRRRTSKQLRSAFLFVTLDVLFRQIFRAWRIRSFPSSLGGCAAVFAALLALPKSRGESIHDKYLEPGAILLAQWLPVLFVPSLITLPLADAGLGSTLEWTKVGGVVVGGLALSLWTTAASVLAIRQYSNSKKTPSSIASVVNDVSSSSSRFIASSDGQIVDDSPIQAMSDRAVEYAETLKCRRGSSSSPFSPSLLRKLTSLSALTGASSIALRYMLKSSSSSGTIPWLPTLQATITSLCLLFTTLTTFVFGSRLPSRITKRIHPLVTCTTLTWITTLALARAFGKSFASMLKRYYRGGHGTHAHGTLLAAGDVLLFLLGPAVVSLSSSMYQRRQLLQDNWKEVLMAIGVSTMTGLFGTALAVRMLQLANPYLRLSLLSRNITSPLAMAMANVLGADVSLAVTMVVITGLLGANFGTSLLDYWKIQDPVARGLAMGSAAHGLGTAALASSNELDAFPFAALSMALTASAAVSLVSIPVVRQMLVQLALGG